MISRIKSIYIILFISISAIFFYIGALLIWLSTTLFDKRLVILHLYTSIWASVYFLILPDYSVKFEGKEKIDKKKVYIIVSNHQSQLDIITVYGLFTHFKWVSKAEVFKLPFIGWNMTLNRYIKIKRGDKDSIKNMMDDCEKTLLNGSSLYFFPEGTRSKTGIMKSFKPGAFVLAKKMKIPILPIVINGAKDALPKKSLLFHGKHKINIKVLDEIPYNDFADKTNDETGEMVRDIMAQHIYEHREITNRQ